MRQNREDNISRICRENIESPIEVSLGSMIFHLLSSMPKGLELMRYLIPAPSGVN
jgi:hypothetical protein